jgi:hypothetical protein
VPTLSCSMVDDIKIFLFDYVFTKNFQFKHEFINYMKYATLLFNMNTSKLGFFFRVSIVNGKWMLVKPMYILQDIKLVLE